MRGSVVTTVALAVVAAAGLGATAVPAGASLTAATSGHRILLANNDGSHARVVAAGDQSFISPNGKQIAVLVFDANPESAATTLKLVASGGGAPTPVASGNNCRTVVWSPDSTRLACTGADQTNPDITRIDLIDASSGSGATLVTGTLDAYLSFSPDSRQLAFVQAASFGSFIARGGSLKVIDLATRRVRTLRGRARRPVWGPNLIAFGAVTPHTTSSGFVQGFANVAVVRSDGRGFRQLTHRRPDKIGLLFGMFPVDWSANGRRLLGELSGEDENIQSYAIDPVHARSRRLGGGLLAPWAISDDGRFVFGDSPTSEGPQFGFSKVFRVPWAAGGKARVILRHAATPSVSG